MQNDFRKPINKLSYSFNYHNNFRFILFQCNPVINTPKHIANIKKIVLFFPIIGEQFLGGPFIYNYFYLLKFFFGFKGFISKRTEKFKLGVTTFSTSVQCILKKNHIYGFLNVFVDDILPISNVRTHHIYLVSAANNTYEIELNDLSIFYELKTNIGLFDLLHTFKIRMYFQGNNASSLLATLKFPKK